MKNCTLLKCTTASFALNASVAKTTSKIICEYTLVKSHLRATCARAGFLGNRNCLIIRRHTIANCPSPAGSAPKGMLGKTASPITSELTLAKGPLSAISAMQTSQPRPTWLFTRGSTLLRSPIPAGTAPNPSGGKRASSTTSAATLVNGHSSALSAKRALRRDQPWLGIRECTVKESPMPANCACSTLLVKMPCVLMRPLTPVTNQSPYLLEEPQIRTSSLERVGTGKTCNVHNGFPGNLEIFHGMKDCTLVRCCSGSACKKSSTGKRASSDCCSGEMT